MAKCITCNQLDDCQCNPNDGACAAFDDSPIEKVAEDDTVLFLEWVRKQQD